MRSGTGFCTASAASSAGLAGSSEVYGTESKVWYSSSMAESLRVDWSVFTTCLSWLSTVPADVGAVDVGAGSPWSRAEMELLRELLEDEDVDERVDGAFACFDGRAVVVLLPESVLMLLGRSKRPCVVKGLYDDAGGALLSGSCMEKARSLPFHLGASVAVVSSFASFGGTEKVKAPDGAPPLASGCSGESRMPWGTKVS